MDNTGSKKVLILYIYEILKRYSDVNHPLTQNEIASLVRDVYGMSCDRKTIMIPKIKTDKTAQIS